LVGQCVVFLDETVRPEKLACHFIEGEELFVSRSSKQPVADKQRSRVWARAAAEVHGIKRCRITIFPNRLSSCSLKRNHDLFGLPGIPDTGRWPVHRVQSRSLSDYARVSFAKGSAPNALWPF